MNFLFILVLMVIIVSSVLKVQKQAKGDSKTTVRSTVSNANTASYRQRNVKTKSVGSNPSFMNTSVNFAPAQSLPVRREPPAKTLRDNIGNDWLSEQLNEERKAFRRTSDMFDLKEHHANSCDAQLLKEFHRFICDANGIDDGIAK